MRRRGLLWAKCAASCSFFKNKSTSGVRYPNKSANPLPFPSLCENGWSSRVVHHQETSVERERQVRKREADRETTEAPPQSLAFSCGEGIKSRKPLAIDNFDDRITHCNQVAARADLRVVGMTGLGPSANLLRPHPVALHRGVMCNGVKVTFRPVFAKPKTNEHNYKACWWEAD